MNDERVAAGSARGATGEGEHLGQRPVLLDLILPRRPYLADHDNRASRGLRAISSAQAHTMRLFRIIASSDVTSPSEAAARGHVPQGCFWGTRLLT